MMLLRRCGLGLALLAISPSLLWAQGRPPPLTWMVMDLPPAGIIEDGRLTDGFVDLTMKMIFDEMPEFEHRVEVTPISRIWLKLSEGAPTCFTTALVTPERERVAYITLTHLILPLQLVARSAAVDKLPRNKKGEVLADQLFERSDLSGLVTPKRSCSAPLDALLAARPASSGIHEVAEAGSGSNILQMLSRGRADYTIEYDFVLNYQYQKSPQTIKIQDLRVLPFAGAQPMPAGIACPRTEWGHKMILRLDAILLRISQRAQYREASRRWMSPDIIKRNQATYNEFYRRRMLPTDPAKFPPPLTSN